MKSISLNSLVGGLALASAISAVGQTFTADVITQNTESAGSGRTARLYMNSADGTATGNRAPLGTQLWIAIDKNGDGKIAGFSEGVTGGSITDTAFKAAFNATTGTDLFFAVNPISNLTVDGTVPGSGLGQFQRVVTGLPADSKNSLWLVGWNAAGSSFNGLAGDGVGPTSVDNIQAGDKFGLYKFSDPSIPQVGNALLPISRNMFLNANVITAVPEPGTYAMIFGGGLAAVAFVRRARSKNA